MENQVFKIRSTLNGKFSRGNDIPTFTNKGKEWKSLAHVNSHLNQMSTEGRQEYDKFGAEIVTYELREVEIETKYVKQHMKELEQRNIELRKQLESNAN